MSVRPLSLTPVVIALLAGAVATSAAACTGAVAVEPSVPPPVAPGPPPPPPEFIPGSALAGDAGLVDAAIADAAAGDGDAAQGDAPVSGPKAAATAAACPADMVLVDGDYCTELELKCLRSTYAKQNRKTICHDFKEPSVCTGQKQKKRYCIDKYEYPNKKGQRPEVMNNFPQAQKLCAGLGKRICTETEWTMACEGPSYKPYPYGYARDPKKCNGDRPYRNPNVEKTVSSNKAEARAEVERLWQGVESGSQPECVSDYGVFDMPGNADELAASETFSERGKFDNVTTGGPWLDGVRNQCRPKIYDHNEGFAYYYLSFRCCAEADGKPTDPRSPKQIKRGERWRP